MTDRNQVKDESLRRDLELLDQIVTPVRKRESALASRSKKRHRTSELILIVGAVVAVVLGAAATATGAVTGTDTGSAENLWLGLETVLTFFLGAMAFVENRIGWHKDWLLHRRRTAALKAEWFLFLGRAGVYREAADPVRVLKKRVVSIERMGN